MRHLFLRWMQVSCLLVCSLLPVGIARAETTAEGVKSSLEVMHDWLGDDDKGKAWKAYLQSKELLTQIERGPKADRKAVAGILKKYSGDNRGLRKKQIADVREILETWLDELSIVPIQELSKLAQEVKGEFAPVTEVQVEQAKAKLDAAIKELDDLLVRSGKGHETGWKKILLWKEMQEQLQATEGPKLNVLQAVGAKYYMNKNGLEMKQFMGVRNSLREYVSTVYYFKKTNANRSYEAKLDKLTKLLDAHIAKPTTSGALQIGRRLGWLKNAGQADALVKAVQHHYMQPNLVVTASKRIVGEGISDDVNEKTQVHEVILGTDINGTAQITGKTSATLVPNDKQAVLEIHMKGHAHAQNVGTNGPATIYNHSKTSIDASKRLVFDAHGLHGQPARANCVTKTTIDDIGIGRIGSNTAWQRVNEQKPQAESIASQRAELRVQRRMNERAKKLLVKANKAFNEKFRYPLLRRDAFPSILKFSTTADQIRVQMVQAGDFQLGAASKPPEVDGKHDLTLRIHESLVGNLSESALGGMTLDDEKIAAMIENLTGKVPEELKITEDKEPWSITFYREQPITVEVNDNMLKISIRGERFTRGITTINDEMLVTANYKVAMTPLGVKLTRQGEVEANYVKVKTQNIAQTSFKSVIRNKFNALLKPDIAGKGLKLPGRWEKLGTLRLKQLDCTKGWLALGWEAQHDKVLTAEKVKK